ncbi:breast carcinoma-amplified sequence 1 [Rhynchocyon petersi]
MGNQMSVLQRMEDQEDESETFTGQKSALELIKSLNTADSKAPPYQPVASESESIPNGAPLILSTRTVQRCEEVDLGISVQEDNAAASSPATMEMGSVAEAGGKNLGKEAKPEAPAARSRLFLTLSRPVPGRAGDRATDSSSGAGRLDVSSDEAPGNKAPSDSTALPKAAAAGPGPHKTPGLVPAEDQAPAASWGPEPLSPERQGAALPKPKDTSFFDRVFKLDKGRTQTPVAVQPATHRPEHRGEAGELAGPSRLSSDVPPEQDLVDSKEKEQEIKTLGCVSEVPEVEIAKENPQITDTTDNNNPIMSFFKTLVSPNKAETKKDPEEAKVAKAESVCDGQAGQKTSETQTKGTKKKHLDSPRLGAAFRKLFRHKSGEKSPSSSADPKSDKVNFIPQETQGATKSPKGHNSSGHISAPASPETSKEGTKEKGPTSLPLGKLFWKKSIKEDSVPTGSEENVVYESPVEAVKTEDVESALHTVDLNEDGETTPEPTDTKPKKEDSKPPRTSLMAFFRQMSVKGDAGNTHPEAVNARDSSCQTSDSTEKATTPPEPEPEPATAGQKGKNGSSKDKKPAAEANTNKPKSNKQEAKEAAPAADQSVVEVNSLQNGDRSQKKPERQKQSIRGFLKGLGPKQMLDAQVQTDPVSIGPVGKSK